MIKVQDVVIINKGSLKNVIGYVSKYSSSDDTYMLKDVNEEFLGFFKQEDLTIYSLDAIMPILTNV